MIRYIGAVMIIAGCGGVGLSMAAAHKKTEKALQQLIRALEYMIHEVQYRMSTLPELSVGAAGECTGSLRQVFTRFSEELRQQVSPDAAQCMTAALDGAAIPDKVRRNLYLLGRSMGRYDLPGQLSGMESVRQLCKRDLDGLLCNRDVRLRSYQTLALCAGAALVILFI